MNVLVGICNVDGHIQSAVFVQHVQDVAEAELGRQLTEKELLFVQYDFVAILEAAAADALKEMGVSKFEFAIKQAQKKGLNCLDTSD